MRRPAAAITDSLSEIIIAAQFRPSAPPNLAGMIADSCLKARFAQSSGFLSPPAPRGSSGPGQLFPRTVQSPNALRAGSIAGPFFCAPICSRAGAIGDARPSCDRKSTIERSATCAAPSISFGALGDAALHHHRDRDRCRRSANRSSGTLKRLRLAGPVAELDPAAHHVGVGDGAAAVLAAPDRDRHRLGRSGRARLRRRAAVLRAGTLTVSLSPAIDTVTGKRQRRRLLAASARSRARSPPCRCRARARRR